MSRSTPTSPLPKSPPRILPSNLPNDKIYVLSSDGSSLFLIDPTSPSANEEPPSYTSLSGVAAVSHPPPPSQGESSRPPLSSNSVESQSRVGRRGTVSSLDSRILSISQGGEGEPTIPPTWMSARTRSLHTSPQSHFAQVADETTRLLLSESVEEVDDGVTSSTRRGWFRSIVCGEDDSGRTGWTRFWDPLQQRAYWRATFHLLLLNFPFALLVWPPLLVGTLVGTALLITLPLGAVVWWLTLIIARSAARLETIMQFHHHPSSSRLLPPTYHPIFHRIKEPPTHDPNETQEIVWEKNFIKCSWAMFSDHYSYSSLSYFLLIKPLLTLPSFVLLLALFAIALVSGVGLPIYLRLARRWGKWQAGIAFDNL